MITGSLALGMGAIDVLGRRPRGQCGCASAASNGLPLPLRGSPLAVGSHPTQERPPCLEFLEGYAALPAVARSWWPADVRASYPVSEQDKSCGTIPVLELCI